MKSRIRFIVLAAVVALALPLVALAEEGAAAAKPATTTSHHSAKSGKAMHKVDLNSASKEQLMKLPGMTDEAADKIIADRPFKSTSELVSKSVVTEAEYAKLKGHVVAKSESKTAEPKKS